MLAMSDISIDQFLPVFADVGVSVAFLVPTPTGYGKSIMDAIGSVRELLKSEGIHDYERQEQGPAAKKMIPAFFVGADGLVETEASLYRPMTKQGDPRIWFKDLKRHCSPKNLLALVVVGKKIYVINLSSEEIQRSLRQGFVHDLLMQIKNDIQSVAAELLRKIKAIHDHGFLPSITPGDPGVGDTLEHALGISRNNARTPDYKGIELKTTRTTRHGGKRPATRSTLFAKTPDAGLTYREIVEQFGKVQTPRGKTEPRLQLYETFSTKRINGYGLTLAMNASAERLEMQNAQAKPFQYVSSWQMANLKSALLIKHHETFWVSASSEDRNGQEWFRYDKILHTRKPNASLLEPLIDNGTITLDLAAHITNGKWRDHGILFKMKPEQLGLLLGSQEEYDLETLRL